MRSEMEGNLEVEADLDSIFGCSNGGDTLPLESTC